MTLRKTEIIEWSTTPAELRRIADDMEEHILTLEPPFGTQIAPLYGETKGELKLKIYLDQGQWQAEQAEGKE